MLFWLELMSLLNIDTPVNNPCELLNVFNFFQILFINFLNDFKWSMAFTEYFVNSLTVIILLMFFNFHTVTGSFCTFNVEVNLAVSFEAFNDSANLYSFLAANHASAIELLVV